MVTLSYEKYFPFSQIRDEQKKAIECALNAFLVERKRYVILEMGPGCGKSATGVTIARQLQALFEINDPRVQLGSAYFLTTQKVLQEQYVRDFGEPVGNLKMIKSAGGYTCQFFEQRPEPVSCAEIQRLLSSKVRCGIVYKMCEEKCKFREAKAAFNDAVEGTTNYAYFLTTSTYTKDIQRRGLLVLDEAHNIESVMSNFVKIAFSNIFYREVLGIKTPPVNAKQQVVYDWLVQKVRPRLRDVIKKESKKVSLTDDSTEAIAAAKKLERLKRNFSRIEYFINVYDPKTWVLDTSQTDRRGERIYEFKPIVVRDYCQSMLYSNCDRVLFLSATILDRDVFCESIGIPQEDTTFLRIPSPFPPKNRPVHYIPVGSMSKKMIDDTLPIMAQVVQEILDQHPQEKGIIHTTNYRIAKYLIDTLGSKRLLSHGSDDREETIEFHMKSKEPTVLLSPSMMEGVDLAGPASRFQILCKVPFPYLGDAAVQRRMKLNKDWYNYQTVKSVVQALGRSIRHVNDHATSYILDSDWKRFYDVSKDMFPLEFSEAIV